MGKTFAAITPDLQAWIKRQKIFFVATAPLAAAGHINCSPKGGDTFRILGDREVAYLDLTGSGVETVAHLQENRRIVIMFCAFAGPPKIVRLHGRGTVTYPGQPAYDAIAGRFNPHRGARSIIRVTLTRISDSCGYAVPQLDFVKPRDALDRWTEAKDAGAFANYRRRKNSRSIDGLPALPSAACQAASAHRHF